MKRKILLLITIFVILVAFTGCKKNDALLFKEDYESINDKENKSGKKHRSVTINEENPFIISSAKEVVEKINNKDSFYIYFGSKLCPWCRSVIEKAIEVANNNNITKIYYVDIWNDEGEEILRDKYEIDDKGNVIKTIEGKEEYYELLKLLDNVLEDYTYTKDEEKVSFGEKRIYAPNFIYISNGKAIKLTTGISSLQKDSRETLTEEMLKDEEKEFNDIFINVCDSSC
mgnify:CR=1 FL=1